MHSASRRLSQEKIHQAAEFHPGFPAHIPEDRPRKIFYSWGNGMSAIGHNSQFSSGNWIAVSRDLEKHPIVGFGQPVKPADPSRGSYSRAEAWQSLLFQAQWRAEKADNKGRVIWLDRGQLMAGLHFLAEKWNWTAETVRWFLRKLEVASMTTTVKPTFEDSPNRPKPEPKGRTNTVKVVSICNYDLYQVVRELDTMLAPNPNPKPTPSAPQESNNRTKKQEESPIGLLSDALAPDPAPTKKKRGKKVPPEAYTNDFEEFWKIYPRREGKAEAAHSWERLSLTQKRRAYVSLKTQLSVLEQRRKDPRGNFCPLPSTWINQGRFDDEVVAAQRHEEAYSRNGQYAGKTI